MVPRETLSGPRVQPILFRKYLREAIADGHKTSTRRLLTDQNSTVQPGTFEGVQWESGRVRAAQTRAELRAQCRFESGRVRVVSIFPDVRPGDLFYVKVGRYGSRKASELTLEVRRVRGARLQDMTEIEAITEGVAFVPKSLKRDTARETFAALWDALGGFAFPNTTSWAANPWVWVYDFQRHNINVDEYRKP